MIIIGSCVIFSCLYYLLIGLCVTFLSKFYISSAFTFHLNWKPVLRDSIVNLIAFVFLYVIFRDQMIFWYEAFVGCFLYVAYVCMMGVNKHVMNFFEFVSQKILTCFPIFHKICQVPEPEQGANVNVQLLEDFDERVDGSSSDIIDTELESIAASEEENKNELNLDGIDVDLDDVDDLDDLSSFPIDSLDASRHSIQEDEDFGEKAPEDHAHYPSSVFGWIWFVLAWPYELLFHYTIPPVNGRFKYQFIASFIISLVWLGIFTTFMVKWTEKIGCILGIEDAIMGVTFLAIGTSMPDCLTSIFVARTGRGNMAVCNALVCLNSFKSISDFFNSFL